MTETLHPLVKRLLDGELSLGDLPPELRGEGAEALRLLGALDRTPVALSAQLEARVMAEVRRRARSPIRRVWRRLVEPRDIELRLRVRPWVVWGAALAAAAAVAVLLTRPPRASEGARLVRVDTRDSVYVRFVLYAPTARRVAVAGTFNQWDQNASPLRPVGRGGVWAVTRALHQGHDQYAAAAAALGSGGHTDVDVVEGGAYALGAGLGVKQVQQLARASHPPYDAALTLRVAATLAALGVPAKNTVDLLQSVISAGRPPSELLDLPGEVQAGVAQ